MTVSCSYSFSCSGVAGDQVKQIRCFQAQKGKKSQYISRQRSKCSAASSKAQIETIEIQKTKQSTQNSNVKKQLPIDDGVLLGSTWQHRAWVYLAGAALFLILSRGILQINTVQSAVVSIIAFVSAYILSDLGTGIYHWSVDNYGSGKTPIVGKQIAAFQGHHKAPWTITYRQFCNNVNLIFKPMLPIASIIYLLPSAGPAADIFLSTFAFFVCMSQQFHAWAHMKKKDLPPLVNALHSAGLLISPRAHGQHHRSPFINNYCIVSGVWNKFMDGEGPDKSVYRGWEKMIYEKTGVAPRCWSDPEELEPDFAWDKLTYYSEKQGGGA